ncbi:transferrin [Holotrichia oblita]|uniref:Transferrin n=1 Tax=Holotrichia oblita TaxID=644536 RepID=A0ACB9SYC4_HOLOL|nr:transferrin [Holotrichia oblita]
MYSNDFLYSLVSLCRYIKTKLWSNPEYYGQELTNFLGNSCMPGIQDLDREPYPIGINTDKLCSLCGNDPTVPTDILCAPQSLANACEQINRTEDITCLIVKNSIDCVYLIENGNATMALISAEEAILASNFVNNITVLGEFRDPIGKRNTEIETIVIVNKEIKNFSLKGKRYCHPGFDTNLISPAILKEFEIKVLTENNVRACINGDTTLAESYINELSNFFGPSCRPGEWVVGNRSLDNALKSKYPQLLKLCDRAAYEENIYLPFLQSLNCVLNGDGDIGFTTIHALKSDSTRYENAVQNFALLCKNGTTVNITEECTWTRQPRSLLVVNIDYVENLSNDLRTWFSTSIYDNTIQLTSVTESVDEEINSRLLSDKQILPLKEILFPNPKFLIKIIPGPPATLKEYVKDFRDIPTSNSQLCKDSIKLCVLPHEGEKCKWLQQAALNYGVQPAINCVLHQDKTECISDIKAEKADIVVISDNMTYFANRRNLTILAFGEQQTKDMKRSVVIVNSTTIKSLDDLNNKRGCFSEYADRAFLAFISKLKQKIWPDSLYYGENLNNFLNESCMPGIQDESGHEPYSIGLNFEQLCSICVPSVDSIIRDTCKPDSTNDYYGNDGALNCLQHGESHFSVLTLEDGVILPVGTSILCQNGTLTTALPIDDNCALTVTIDDVIIGRKHDKKTKDIVLLLEELDQRFALQSRSPFKIFDMFRGNKDLIFRDITTGLEIASTTNNKHMKTQLQMFEDIPHLRSAIDNSKPDSGNNTLCTTPRFLTECQQINRTNDIQCIVLEDELSCIERVDGGGATFASVSAEGAFLGAGKINLLKLATFQLETESNPYDYQTAIVTNQNIPDGLSGLRNISYCHPGFDTTDVNLLLLIEFERQVLLENSIDICSNDTAPLVEKHIRAIHDFFGPSCRPGRWVQDTEFDTILTFRQNLTVQRSRQCATEMRWCTISDNEQRKCEAWSRAGLHNGIQPVLSCIQAQSRRECISFIDKNDADAVTIGADFGYFAKLAGLEAIAFPETEQEYLIHTLLIVRPTITRRESLRTRRGCFNRYGSAAWLSFINATKSIILNSNKCEYGELLNDALGSSCMPGAGSLNLPNLCSLCIANGTGEHTCATNSTNLYAGNQGALDCLRDVGDFAVITKTDGLVLPENVTVMCRNGTLAHNMGLDVDNNCYLTIITTDEIVTRRNDPKNLDIQLMLRESDRRFATDPRSPFKLFGTFDSIPNLLFRILLDFLKFFSYRIQLPVWICQIRKMCGLETIKLYSDISIVAKLVALQYRCLP